MSRRRLLIGGAAAVAGATGGRLLTGQPATAGTTHPAGATRPLSAGGPVSLGALCTVKDNDSGTLVVVVRTDAPADVRVRAYPTASGPTDSAFSAWVGTLSRTDPGRPNTHEAQLELVGAAPPDVPGGHSFRVEVAAPGASSWLIDPVVYAVPQRPRTGLASRFTVAVGSCLNIAYPSLTGFLRNNHARDTPAPALRNVVNPACCGPNGLPVTYFHIGDFGYPDVNGSVAKQYEDDPVRDRLGFRSAFQWVKGHTDVRALAELLPVVVLPDDHDYGQDGAYRGPATTPSVPAGFIPGKGPYADYAALAFQDTLPMYPFGSELAAPPNRVIGIGEVDFFLLDNRKFADPQGTDPAYWQNHSWPTVLGPVQRTWLKDSLKASTAKVKVVLAPQTFHFYWNPNERKDILNWIATNGVSGRIVFMTGDKHCQAHLQWRTAAGPKVDEVMCSPVRNTSTAPISAEQLAKDGNYTTGLRPAWTFTRRFPTGNRVPLDQQPVPDVVAFLELDTIGASEVVRVRMVRGDGSQLYAATLT